MKYKLLIVSLVLLGSNAVLADEFDIKESSLVTVALTSPASYQANVESYGEIKLRWKTRVKAKKDAKLLGVRPTNFVFQKPHIKATKYQLVAAKIKWQGNDSLVLLTRYKQNIKTDSEVDNALIDAGTSCFRAIFLNYDNNCGWANANAF